MSPDCPIAVLGAGTMGAGIAQLAAGAGHPVWLYDAAPNAAARARDRIGEALQRLVARGNVSAAEAGLRLDRIAVAARLDELRHCGLAIEAIVENLDAKIDLLKRVQDAAPEAILASNTSSLSITAIAAGLARPRRLVGLHFFNPPTLMKLVEIASGAMTDPSIVDCLSVTMQRWGQTPVRCRSTPGFIVNRVARPFYGEALRLLTDRVASPATLDAIFHDCGGFRMGPCALMDMIGHDVNFSVTASLHRAFFGDNRYQPSLLQQDLVEAGRLGRKSGRGFYEYGAGVAAEEPADAPLEPAPVSLIIAGDLGPAESLRDMLKASGIEIQVRPGAGAIELAGADLALTDGRTATEREAVSLRPTALFDLARDYAATPRIAVAFSANMPAAVARQVCGLFQALGKRVSVIEDAAGLVLMRTVAMLANEAAEALLQGVAGAEQIDTAMKLGAGYPIGPLAWADAIGAAWLMRVMDALNSSCPDGRYRTASLLRRHGLSGGRFMP